jgi:hypothetical protein
MTTETKTKAPRKSKEELFKDRAIGLTKVILLHLNRLGELASKGGYTTEDTDKIFAAIDARAETIQNLFAAPPSAKSEEDFSL